MPKIKMGLYTERLLLHVLPTGDTEASWLPKVLLNSFLRWILGILWPVMIILGLWDDVAPIRQSFDPVCIHNPTPYRE